MMRNVGLWLCAASSFGCGRVDGDEVASCDPFAVEDRVVELPPILAAGRAADATLYVVTEATDGGWEQLFVSDGDGIRRVDVAGGGGGGSATEMDWLFGVSAHAPPFTLLVTQMGELIRMGLTVGDADAEFLDVDEADEELTLVADDEVLGLTAHDLVRTIVFEYAVSTADGRKVIVLRPDPFEAYEEFRLFFGRDSLTEREVLSVARQEDGGTTKIEFDIGGDTPAVAHFASPLSPELSDTLTIDGESEELVDVDTSMLAHADYTCLTEH